MSIQDEIFDIEHALEDKPESESFDRLCKYIGDLEREIEMYRDFYLAAVDLKIAIKKIEKKK